MLYDPKWDVRPQADLEVLIAWLEGRDPEEQYNWKDCHHCLCAQFFGVGIGWAVLHREMEERTGIRVDSLAMPLPWTFGAALQRARAVAVIGRIKEGGR